MSFLFFRKRIKAILIQLGLYSSAKKARDVLGSIRFLRGNAKIWYRGATDRLPIPSLELIGLVAGSRDIEWFLQGGRLAAESIYKILQMNKIPVHEIDSVIDFGCGCGRVMRNFAELSERTKLYGVDYNPQLISWCAKNLTFAQFSTNRTKPPLDFSAETIGLIYALSVFTHMPEALQLSWIDEFARILKPDGLLIFSTHGDAYSSDLNAEENKIFFAGQLVVRDNGLVGSNSYGAYHPFDYVRLMTSKNFTILDFIPQGAKGNPHQDLYLLRKKQIPTKLQSE